MIAPADTDLSAWYTADDGWLKPPLLVGPRHRSLVLGQS